ncbi:hypothetical protein EJ05DRAFT_475319 [Pseudovirgaria hyperparasitica]|uniref:Uncharacterized protein n=1 Tax=Pseudovirgaria hyperparasitica TaxID=470096 RepID=A0A6A6WDA8_9PEZI|nr:uncharacterized protein EJ05DRAFT_475319 [Pseudovirgaria hyperparasitica]KAF2759091.1 hypothetical protein EJ05DRAFT_475319 [Pseudovirgaria hyperparasitica]
MLPVLLTCKYWFSLAFPYVRSYHMLLRPQHHNNLASDLRFSAQLPRSHSFFAYIKSFELQVADMHFPTAAADDDDNDDDDRAFNELDLTPLIECLPRMTALSTFQLRVQESPAGTTWIRQKAIEALLSALPASVVNLHIDTAKRDFPYAAASAKIRETLQARSAAFRCLKVRLARYEADGRRGERKRYGRTEDIYYYVDHDEAKGREVPVFAPLRVEAEGEEIVVRKDVRHGAREYGLRRRLGISTGAQRDRKRISS